MSHNLCCIGYITKDKIVTPTSTVFMPGGTSYYFAKALKQLSTDNFFLVTAVEESEMHVIEEIRNDGIEVLNLHTEKSVCFENIYGENQNERKQRVTALPDPFTIDQIKNINAKTVHLGSLLHDDFSFEIIKHLSSRCVLSADVQGFLRKVNNQQVEHADWDEKQKTLKYIHTLKANEEEMQVLTGCDDPYEAALCLADWGVREVLLTLGSHGSLIYSKGQFYEIPAFPTLQIVDATGCGDTYMAGYLYQRNRGASEQEAGCYAAAMCTIKLQSHGPFNGNDEIVKRIMTNNVAHII